MPSPLNGTALDTPVSVERHSRLLVYLPDMLTTHIHTSNKKPDSLLAIGRKAAYARFRAQGRLSSCQGAKGQYITHDS